MKASDIFVLLSGLQSQCHQTAEAEPGSVYYDLKGPELEKEILAELRSAIDDVCGMRDAWEKWTHYYKEKFERAEKERFELIELVLALRPVVEWSGQKPLLKRIDKTLKGKMKEPK